MTHDEVKEEGKAGRGSGGGADGRERTKVEAARVYPRDPT